MKEILLKPKHNTYSEDDENSRNKIMALKSNLMNEWGSRFNLIKWDLLLPTTNGDLLGEAVISVQINIKISKKMRQLEKYLSL